MSARNARNVLIVDDDLGDVYLLEKTLQQHGVQNVQSMLNAQEALQYVEQAFIHHHHLPDVIFVDLKMKGMDGFHLIDLLKKKPLFSRIPLVVFSGSNDPADKEKALRLGALAFFQKTQEAHLLKAIVQQVLGITPPAARGDQTPVSD